MIRLCLLITALCTNAAIADVFVPSRTIRAKEIITDADIIRKSAVVPGALSDAALIIGQEARVALYPGRPVRPGDVGPPALVDRNDVVLLFFDRGGLRISTEGRSLGRGAIGERIRVMNLASRSTVTGRIRQDGSIEVE